MSKTKFGYVVDRHCLSHDAITYDEFKFEEDHSKTMYADLWSDSDGVHHHGSQIYGSFEDAKKHAEYLISSEISRLEKSIAYCRAIVLTDPRTERVDAQ